MVSPSSPAQPNFGSSPPTDTPRHLLVPVDDSEVNYFIATEAVRSIGHFSTISCSEIFPFGAHLHNT